MLSEFVHPSYLYVVIRCSYGGDRGHPGTCQLMGAGTSDGILSSGHISGSLCNRLEIRVVVSAVGRLPDVQLSTQWLPVCGAQKWNIGRSVHASDICWGWTRSVAAIRALVQRHIIGPTSHLVILCSKVSVSLKARAGCSGNEVDSG
jgi:hypothetical protein